MPIASAGVQRVNAYDLASQYLHAMGLPNTPQNQRVLASWFMAESARSGPTDILVVGNNPLNITSGAGNYRVVQGNKVAIYDNNAGGISAFNSLIRVNAYGYPGILRGFQASADPGQIIDSIIASGWVTGTTNSYQHGGTNLLREVFAGTHNGGSTSIDPGAGTSAGTPGSSTTPMLSGFGNSISFPENMIITNSDVDKIMAALVKSGQLPDPNSSIAASAAYTDMHDILKKHIGDPWNHTYFKEVQANTFDTANKAGDPIGTGIAGLTAAFLGVIPPLVALVGGAVLGLFGIFLITKEATAGGSAESIVSPIPVFIREKV